ncbi:MFS transporter [Nocardia sp. NBC_01503]|uniref:MFS transporter n=1 Tax=Nocardia sp. NBC_01503 TaxID=2975997 RepID=UPI002E7BD66F|nr:MFS transporter [Nocardia sp. NBC_01503]WTL32760.1 MFS transporter [Nocardia sp. NBC_01503]
MSLLMLLRRPPIAAIWTAQLLSILGDRFYALAIMWVALQLSGPVAMGAVAISESVPFILIGTFGAALLHRCATFRILAGIDAVRVLLVIAVPVVWNIGGTVAVLAVAMILGAFAAVFDPSLGALVPDLVSEAERPALVAAMDLNGRIARIAGPALAGVLLLILPINSLFAADAATFAVSVLALVFLARTATSAAATASAAPGAPSAAPKRASARALLRESPVLRAAFLVHAAGLFLTALPGIGLPLLLAHQLGASPAAYGWVLTATGTAGLIGNLTASRIQPTAAAFLPRFCAAWAVAGALLAATGAANSLVLVLVFASLSGFVTPFISITLGTQLAAYPRPARLRLMSINHTVMRTAGTAGMAIIPVLIASAPARGFILGGTSLTVVAVTAWVISATVARAPIARSVRVTEVASATRTNSTDQAA